MNLEQQLKLQAFLDGELPENETREILAWTQRDGGAAALLAELKNTRAAMVEAELPLNVPETREFFWSKIGREIGRQETQKKSAPEFSIFAALRRLFFPAVALGALVIAGMVAHSYFSGPKTHAKNLADADGAPEVETALADADATTYHDDSEGTTLVWFSDNAPDQGKAPNAIN